MSEQSLDLEADLHEFFSEIVSETLHGRAERPSPIVQQYLVGLLEDSALSLGRGPIESTLEAPLAVQLSHALHSPLATRFEKLRRLGDGILLVGGIYPSHLQHSGLKDPYVSALGARAYLTASSLMVPGDDADLVGREALELLDRMAHSFGRLMKLLRDVTDTLVARSARTAGDLALLCERWLRFRSAHLARLLVGKGIQVHKLVECCQ